MKTSLFEEVIFRVGGLFALTIVALGFLAIIDIPRAYQEHVKSIEELQTILRDECGMDYTFEQVERNGENLAHICEVQQIKEERN